MFVLLILNFVLLSMKVLFHGIYYRFDNYYFIQFDVFNYYKI